MTVAAVVMPAVEKHTLSSSGAHVPSGRRTPSENSHSNAARTLRPVVAAAAIWRLRNARGHAAHGSPSSVRMSTVIAAACGA